MKANLTLLGLLLTAILKAQTYFYIDQISIVPPNPTTLDEVSIQLIGNLSSSGSYIVSADAQVNGSIVALTVTAASTGGLTVLVPHTETISVGQLPAGDYTIAFTLNSFGILDGAPVPQHAFTVTGGDPCSNLELVSVQWHAFTDTAIVVHVQNSNTVNELFDYPNFILFDASGDTLAKETVNFFGIGEDSWHAMRVMDGVEVPDSPFNGRLELWIGFTTDMACSWDLEFDLCPPPPCVTVYPSIGNLGGALITASYDWVIYNGPSVAAMGQFTLADAQQSDADTICLPPGDYVMEVSPLGPPAGGNPMYMVAADGWQSTEAWPVSWSLPIGLDFAVHEPCIDGTNGMAMLPVMNTSVVPVPDGILIRRSDGTPVGTVRLLDSQGRTLLSASGSGNELVLAGEWTGLLLVSLPEGVAKVIR
ncbi:MAG: hypothetical protein IPK70_05710 [Flavobacteriales bacterium]|jgi:hypothetical protein|nr:hypothetical protein [Flavobacteriales bacterium]